MARGKTKAGPEKASGGLAAKPPEAKSRLEEIVALTLDTAEAKGWSGSVTARDDKNFRYATVSVQRYTGHQEITGLFEILCDKTVSISAQPTSFYHYGFSDLHKAIANEFKKITWLVDPGPTPQSGSKQALDVDLVERLLRRFHKVIRQVKHRHDNRSPFVVSDEYDIQDLLHAILRGLFDDVRPEEYTPSYGGGSSRMDFLLKSEKIVIEAKFASASLRDKQVGDQLLIDIGRYQVHPGCRKLLCFIYDPSGFLKNPAGLEADLSKAHGTLQVKVVVVSL
jgi:hypothetical protein